MVRWYKSIVNVVIIIIRKINFVIILEQSCDGLWFDNGDWLCCVSGFDDYRFK